MDGQSLLLLGAHVYVPAGEPHTVWYLIIEGPQMGMYKNYATFIEKRDKPFVATDENEDENDAGENKESQNKGFSWRAGWFWCFEDAQNWIQAVLCAGF